jgi:hypothetical protein
MAGQQGLLVPGNIDIHDRPVVQNSDGSISTVRSISIGTDQGEVLIPTVVGNKVVSNEEAIAHYKQTGQHLGIFDNEADATAYAQSLHNEQAQEYANKPVTSPFNSDQQQSPFGDGQDVQPQSNDNVATPLRTATMALAMLNKAQDNTRQSIDQLLDQNIQMSQKIIESGQEYSQRLQAVVDGTKDRMAGLQQIVGMPAGNGQLFTPDLVRNVQQTTAADRANRIDDLSNSALEEQAIHAIQDKLAAGDEAGARAVFNRMDPSKSTTYGALKDFYTTDLMIGNAIERANLDANEEPVWHKILTTVASLPDSFLLKTMRSYLGNVQDGTGSYSSSVLRSIFDPVGELGKQVLAWQSMPLEQKGKYLPNLLANIQSNSSYFGLHDPGKALELLNSFKGAVEMHQRVAGDVMSGLDLAMIAPMFKGIGTGLTHGTEILTGMGARAAATNRVANAFDIAANEGLAAATQKTAVVPDELVEQGLPKSINPLLVPTKPGVTKGELLSSTAKLNPDFKIQPVSIAGDVADQTAYAREVLNAPEFQLLNSPDRFFSQEEKEVAIKNTLDTIKARTNSNVLDYEPQTVRLTNGQQLTQLDVTINKPFATEDEARLWLHNQGYGADATNVTQDTSGQFFPRVKMFMRETGFYTNDINPPKQHFLARWFGSTTTTSDPKLFAKGTTAGQVQQQWTRELKNMNKTVTKLSPNDRTYLREVVQKGVNEERWLSPSEFDTIWQRATGKLPNDNVKAAYFNYRSANDLDYEMRNANTRAELAIRGVENVKFNALGKDVDGFGVVEHDLKPVDEPLLDTSTGITHKASELGEKRLKELEGEGHFIVTTEEPVKLKDGSYVRKFLVKKGELEANQLPEKVLPYSEGGHRVYADKFFVKQANEITLADGVKRLEKPNVYVTAGTKAEAAKWAQVMEDARLAVRDGKDSRFLDENIFKGQRGLPTGKQFIDNIGKTWTLDQPFEALFDRELPSAYAKNGGKFAEESGASGFYRTNGQLYYSAKGDALKNVHGDLAPTIDPFKMQNQALFNVARLSSFDDFKTSAVQRWVNTYGQFLEYNKNATPAEIFNSAAVGRGVQRDLAHQIEGQREAIRRMLNFRGQFDLEKENALRRLHEWMVGDSDNELRQWISKAPLWLMDHNPVNTLRGLAFDMKLGMFNPGQLFVQVSTAFSAMAMSPSAGLKGMFTIPAMIAYRTAVKNGIGDNILDLLAKRGFAKLSGFSSESEFKRYIKFLDKSGIFAFGDSHLLVNTSHPAAAYSFLSKQDAVRTAGRFFFNRAEDANRLVAARIAYDEAVKRFGSVDFGNFEFNEFMRARTENYSFNMSQTSAAAWQKGLLSIPTQFWAYNWRMLEALVGKQFTNSQKARLLASQIFMGGAAGVPAAGLVMDYVNNRTGSAPSLNGSAGEQAWATVQRGMVDELIHLTTGADVQVGQRLGTGDFFQQTAEKLMGYSEYGAKTTPADMLGGATYSVLGEALGSAFALVQHWAAAETGGIDPYEMTKNDWELMFKQISSVNNIAFKAWYAKQYGIYTSQQGRVLLSNLPAADAPFFALGFAPGELRDRSAIMAWKENRQQMENDAATFINARWQESVREPDKFEQNARIISQFVNMLPPEYKMDVLRRAHLGRDPSDYDRLLRIRQSTQMTDEAINEINQEFNSQPQPDALTPANTNEEVTQNNG